MDPLKQIAMASTFFLRNAWFSQERFGSCFKKHLVYIVAHEHENLIPAGKL